MKRKKSAIFKNMEKSKKLKRKFIVIDETIEPPFPREQMRILAVNSRSITVKRGI